MSETTIIPENQPGADDRERLKQLLRERMGSTGSWFPLTHGQEALWFLWKLAPNSVAYNIPIPVGVGGELDVSALQRSFQGLSDRHACLRTKFKEVNGKPHQCVIEDHEVHFETVDATSWAANRLQGALAERSHHAFDLESEAYMRVTLFRRSNDRYLLIVVMHHIISDLWSGVVLMDELRELYMAEKNSRSADLPALPLNYEDYVRWHRSNFETQASGEAWEYWNEELSGELPLLDLPTDHTRPVMQSFRGGTVVSQFDAKLTGQLKELAAVEGATLFMTLLAGYGVLLARYAGQDDMVIGSPTAGRPRADLAGIVGDFVNMVSLRCDLSDAPTFRQLLSQVRDKVIKAVRYQDYPFSAIVDRLQTKRDLSRSPIFQTTFVLQRFHRFQEFSRYMIPTEDEPEIPFGDLTLEPVPLENQAGQFDLNLEMKENEKGQLMGHWKYAMDLFEGQTIERMADSFETLLGEIAKDPDKPITQLPMLISAQSQKILALGRGLKVDPPENGVSVCELFEAQIDKYGDRMAVSCKDESLTYAELGQRVLGFARCLIDLGVGSDDVVAVLMPRGLDFVTALLAVSKAGGAFLPLDPRHPLSRTSRIFENSKTPLVLTIERMEQDVRDALAHIPDDRRPNCRQFRAIELARSGSAKSEK